MYKINKIIKNKKIKILFTVICCMCIFITAAYCIDVSGGALLSPKWHINNNTITVKTNVKWSADGKPVYCLNRGQEFLAGDYTGKSKIDVDPQIKACLLRGYPNHDDNLGKERAYEATQFAIWTFCNPL